MSKANILGIDNSYKAELHEFSHETTWKRVIIYFNDKVTDSKMRSIVECINKSLLRISSVYSPGYLVNRPNGSYFVHEVMGDFSIPKHIEGLLNHSDTVEYTAKIDVLGPNLDLVSYDFTTIIISDETPEN